MLRRNAVAGIPATEDYILYLTLSKYCAYCGKNIEGKAVVEHIHPVKKGGNNASINLTAACVSCNSRKSANNIMDFFNAYIR